MSDWTYSSTIIIDQVNFFENHPSGHKDVISSIIFTIRCSERNVQKKNLVVELEYDENNFIEYSNLNNENFVQWIESIWPEEELNSIKGFLERGDVIGLRPE